MDIEYPSCQSVCITLIVVSFVRYTMTRGPIFFLLSWVLAWLNRSGGILYVQYLMRKKDYSLPE